MLKSMFFTSIGRKSKTFYSYNVGEKKFIKEYNYQNIKSSMCICWPKSIYNIVDLLWENRFLKAISHQRQCLRCDEKSTSSKTSIITILIEDLVRWHHHDITLENGDIMLVQCTTHSLLDYKNHRVPRPKG